VIKARVLAVIGARLNSSRLPKKHLLTLAGQPMIARICQRIERINEIDHVTIATTADDYNQPLVDWGAEAGKHVFAFQGDVNDLVGRVNAVVEQFNPDVVVYCCGDSPLIEPVTVSHLITALMSSPDADTVKLGVAADTRAYIHEGFSVYKRSVWDRIVTASTTPPEKEHVGIALKRFSHQLTMVDVPEDAIYATLQHRISVDTVSDYRFMQEIYRRWYFNHSQDSIVSLKWVIESLQKDSELRSLNAHVQQKTIEEKYKRILVVTQVGKTVGLGHLKRSIILAQALQEIAKANVALWIYGEQYDSYDLSLIPHEFCPASHEFDVAVCRKVDRFRPQTVIFDIETTADNDKITHVLQRLRKEQVNLVGIDGLVNWVDQLDLVYVPSFYLSADYDRPQYQSKLVYGWDAYLLRKPPQQPRWTVGTNVIVLTGGSDTANLACYLPQQLDEHLPGDAKIHWIKGPFANSPEIPVNTGLHWTIYDAPDDIYPIASQMNYALSVYGVSFFEMLQLGLPSVVFNPYKNTTSREMDALRKENVAMVAENSLQAVHDLAGLMENHVLANRLALKGNGLLTGAGIAEFAQRVVRLSFSLPPLE